MTTTDADSAKAYIDGAPHFRRSDVSVTSGREDVAADARFGTRGAMAATRSLDWLEVASHAGHCRGAKAVGMKITTLELNRPAKRVRPG